MAITRRANVIIVPSADAGTTPILPWSGDNKQPVRIEGIRWVGGTTNAHTAEVGDVDATVLWKSVMTTAGLGIDQESTVEITCRGLTVPTLSSGTLYIYLCDE